MAIDALGNLPVGWSYGKGVRISIDVRTHAKELAGFGERRGFMIYASPGVEGEVILDFNQGEYALEVYVKPDQMYDAALTKTVGHDVDVLYDTYDLTVDKVHNLLVELLWRSDTTFDLSTLGTLIPVKEDTEVRLFVSRPTGVSPSLNLTVPRSSRQPFVLT